MKNSFVYSGPINLGPPGRKFHWGWRGALLLAVGSMATVVGLATNCVPLQWVGGFGMLFGSAMINGYAFGRLN